MWNPRQRKNRSILWIMLRVKQWSKLGLSGLWAGMTIYGIGLYADHLPTLLAGAMVWLLAFAICLVCQLIRRRIVRKLRQKFIEQYHSH